ncbi:MAG: MotA/TolQ/ExbB proton channel family protein [Planctomycetota bacterium]
MNVGHLVKFLGDSCYGFLALNFLWGLYCVILIWRRLRQLRFRNSGEETVFLGQLLKHLQARDYAAARTLCDYDFRALPRITLVMIENRKLGYSQLRQLVAELLQRDILADLEFRLSWIATVIKSGPLLGLFGTVLGMMAAFARIGTGEKVQPSQIADEISIALICTAMGLGTAIPFGYILASMSIRLRTLQESLEMGLSRVLECFRSDQS